jgi:hypothetical protein
MSRRNGDKARFGKKRKEQIHRREKIREFRKALMKAVRPDAKSKPPLERHSDIGASPH